MVASFKRSRSGIGQASENWSLRVRMRMLSHEDAILSKYYKLQK
jgi:hypothetical protein